MNKTNENELVKLQDVWKIFSMGNTEVQALRGINLSIHQGEILSIMGPSGSGKSTCMNMIGCLDRPTKGNVIINGRNTATMNENELAAFRNKTVGFVFQQYFLLPNLSVLENVMLPLRYQRIPIEERRERAEEALVRIGLADRLTHKPNELSGGQRQRVAIARATVTKPALILADEPTGALDSETGHSVLDLFQEINAEGTTIVIVTHDQEIGRTAPRMVRIKDGLLSED
ncbi:MAG: ABC transporter ATP-binding protein [Spirochaetales bacterium]|nr:ABC transporter ATP-binding protein [Spirochaetales bacterium]